MHRGVLFSTLSGLATTGSLRRDLCETADALARACMFQFGELQLGGKGGYVGDE
mgnify:FL=1|jgi:hypothetical protein